MRTRHRPLRAALPLAAAAAAGLCQAEPAPEYDDAIAIVANHGPEYLGAARSATSLRPGFLLRWGRFSLSSGGSFAVSRRSGQSRGFGYDIARSDHFDVSLGLRFDGGRSESDSPALAGMGDVARTVRLRLGGEWRFAPQWRLAASWTIDAFGRGGGNLGEVNVRRHWPLSERYSLVTGAGLTIAGDRYLQTYFGVTPEQSARSGYPVYTPRVGLRDASAYVSLRAELGPRWVAIAGVGYSLLLGSAADSPLTRRRGAPGGSLGVAYRF